MITKFTQHVENAIIIGIVVAIFYFLPIKILMIAAAIGVILGIISYFVSKKEIIKILRDDKIEIKNISRLGFCILAVSYPVALLLFKDHGFSFLSIVGISVLMIMVGLFVCGVLTILHAPTHNLQSGKKKENNQTLKGG